MKIIRLKTVFALLVVLAVVGVAIRSRARDDQEAAHGPAGGMAQPIFTTYEDYKWNKILPELGDSSPEICILHVDPKTKATQLMIRSPKAIHIRKHWHSANETHTIIRGAATMACEGKKAELSAGSFNYMPAKMIHEAWLPADCLTFITVDGAWDVNWVEGPPTAADLTK